MIFFLINICKCCAFLCILRLVRLFGSHFGSPWADFHTIFIVKRIHNNVIMAISIEMLKQNKAKQILTVELFRFSHLNLLQFLPFTFLQSLYLLYCLLFHCQLSNMLTSNISGINSTIQHLSEKCYFCEGQRYCL